MKKSEMWFQLANSLARNTLYAADIISSADQIIYEFEERFGDVYQPEDKPPKEKKEIYFGVKTQPAEKDFG